MPRAWPDHLQRRALQVSEEECPCSVMAPWGPAALLQGVPPSSLVEVPGGGSTLLSSESGPNCQGNLFQLTFVSVLETEPGP